MQYKHSGILAGILASGLFFGCSATNSSENESAVKARPLTLQEKLLDYDTAVNQLRNYYAPLQFKERRFEVDFEKIFADLRLEVEASSTDKEFYNILRKLGASTKDGHVSVSVPFAKRFRLPIEIDYLDGSYIVVRADPQSGIEVGSTVVTMDGKTPEELDSALAVYHDNGYERFDKRLRAFRMANRRVLIPENSRSLIKVRNKQGQEYIQSLFWEQFQEDRSSEESPLPSPDLKDVYSISNTFGLSQFGATKPFFADGLKKHKGAIVASLTTEEWTQALKAAGKVGLSDKPAEIFSVLYKQGDKTVYLLRIPSYAVDQRNVHLLTYEALLKKYADIADVLVIDQTHNPGGSVSYLEDLTKLFLTAPGRGFAFAPRADRRWLEDIDSFLDSPELTDFERNAWQGAFFDINEANERGDFLAAPISFSLQPSLPAKAVWKKPILLLIDELCGSGGDAFPMLMKGNKRATLFGNRTAGMGGNVTVMDKLSNSGVQFRLTRSLFYLYREDYSLPDTAVIENNGVTPDIAFNYTAADREKGYKEYIEQFSKEAVKLLDPKEEEPSEPENPEPDTPEEPSEPAEPADPESPEGEEPAPEE